MHSRDLTHEGSAVEKLLLVPVWHEAGRLFAKQVQAALASAESVTRVADGHAPEVDFAADRAVFTGKELADLASPSGSSTPPTAWPSPSARHRPRRSAEAFPGAAVLV